AISACLPSSGAAHPMAPISGSSIYGVTATYHPCVSLRAHVAYPARNGDLWADCEIESIWRNDHRSASRNEMRRNGLYGSPQPQDAGAIPVPPAPFYSEFMGIGGS